MREILIDRSQPVFVDFVVITDDVFSRLKRIVESDRNSILKPNFVTRSGRLHISGHRNKRLCDKSYGRKPVSSGSGWRCFLLERAVH